MWGGKLEKWNDMCALIASSGACTVGRRPCIIMPRLTSAAENMAFNTMAGTGRGNENHGKMDLLMVFLKVLKVEKQGQHLSCLVL